MQNSLYFFSRDLRTHILFRNSWYFAAKQLGYDVTVLCRGFGIINTLKAIVEFIRKINSKKLIFGSSEICLFAIFSNRNDIWVFTGLGRLFTNNNLLSIIVIFYLKILHRGQLVVVLNKQDKEFIKGMIGLDSVLLDGEGYDFTHQIKSKRQNENLTFAYVGRLLYSKGVDKLIGAFARSSEPTWKLLLIGDNDYSNADALPLDLIQILSNTSRGQIIISGFHDNVKDLLSSVDVLVSLSVREGLPFSVLDGIDVGTYIILSPVPGHLSFADLPGVTFCEPTKFDELLIRISNNQLDVFSFDRIHRLDICNRKFSKETIVELIKKILI